MGRIFLAGDTHGGSVGDLDKLTSRKFPEGKDLTKDDYVIILGDFGFVWDMTESKFETNKYKWFEEKPWTTLFIDGNHENFNRLDKLPEVEMFGGKVGVINDSLIYLKRGYVYNIGGKSFFAFGGGFSIDKARRTENKSWWSREMPSEYEYVRGIVNLHHVYSKVDYIITHTCSNKMFNDLSFFFNFHDKIKGEDTLRKYFDDIEKKVEYKKWFYGHFHQDHDFKKHQALYDVVVEII